MAWLWLGAAVLLEVTWVMGLRFTGDWTRLPQSLLVVGAYGLALVPLSLAAQTIPSSIAYAIWVGGGIVGVSFLDIVWFGEEASFGRIACMLLILAGAVGLKLLANES